MLPPSPPSNEDVTEALGGYVGAVGLYAAVVEAYARVLRRHLGGTMDALDAAIRSRDYQEVVRVQSILRAWRSVNYEAWQAVAGRSEFEHGVERLKRDALSSVSVSRFDADSVNMARGKVPLELWSEKASAALPHEDVSAPDVISDALQARYDGLLTLNGLWFYFALDRMSEIEERDGHPILYVHVCIVLEPDARPVRSDGLFGVIDPHVIKRMVENKSAFMAYARRYWVPLSAVTDAGWVSCDDKRRAAYRLEDLGYAVLPVNATKRGAPARSVYFKVKPKRADGEVREVCQFWFKEGR